MKTERIDKILSKQSSITRADAVKLIRAGKVTINGKIIMDNSMKIAPDEDTIEINGKIFHYKKFIYLMMNKPAGVVCASRSPNEKTVIDLLPDELLRPGLFPAGRLDKDTTGFVLITDDGNFAHNILSPSKHICKSYLAYLDNVLSEESINRIKTGMTIENETFMPADITLVGTNQADDNSYSTYKITICQGKYHQIKRMIADCGGNLTALKRISMGNLPIDPSLRPGEAREITDDELALIQQKK